MMTYYFSGTLVKADLVLGAHLVSVGHARPTSRVEMAGEKPGSVERPEIVTDTAARAARMDPPAAPARDCRWSCDSRGRRCRSGNLRRGVRHLPRRRHAPRSHRRVRLFCLPCIKRWAKIETKCPLYKARFSFINPKIGPSGSGVEALHAAPGRAAPKELKRIYLPHRDQVYEGDGELPRYGHRGGPVRAVRRQRRRGQAHALRRVRPGIPLLLRRPGLRADGRWLPPSAARGRGRRRRNITTDHLHETAEDESTRRDGPWRRSLQRAEAAAR